jgi:hypothetical protein
MSKSISNIDWANQLENAIRQFVKEKLELIMREEIKNFLEIEQADTSNMRNGYYQRNLDHNMAGLKGFWSQETEMENFKRSCLPLTNDTPAGWKKPSSRCIKAA